MTDKVSLKKYDISFGCNGFEMSMKSEGFSFQTIIVIALCILFLIVMPLAVAILAFATEEYPYAIIFTVTAIIALCLIPYYSIIKIIA